MRIPPSFFHHSADRLAPALLGFFLVHRSPNGLTAGRIVETEAYLGDKDPASHAYRGLTKRNAAMFGPPGHAYIYFTYGMHWCFNVSCREEGVGEAVLIRALEPVKGIKLMQRRRRSDEKRNLCNGPAKLVQAMGITARQYGVALYRGPLRITTGEAVPRKRIASGPRIGIRPELDQPWRFWIAGNHYTSR